jgi:hypothetical protein
MCQWWFGSFNCFQSFPGIRAREACFTDTFVSLGFIGMFAMLSHGFVSQKAFAAPAILAGLPEGLQDLCPRGHLEKWFTQVCQFLNPGKLPARPCFGSAGKSGNLPGRW